MTENGISDLPSKPPQVVRDLDAWNLATDGKVALACMYKGTGNGRGSFRSQSRKITNASDAINFMVGPPNPAKNSGWLKSPTKHIYDSTRPMMEALGAQLKRHGPLLDAFCGKSPFSIVALQEKVVEKAQSEHGFIWYSTNSAQKKAVGCAVPIQLNKSLSRLAEEVLVRAGGAPNHPLPPVGTLRRKMPKCIFETLFLTSSENVNLLEGLSTRFMTNSYIKELRDSRNVPERESSLKPFWNSAMIQVEALFNCEGKMRSRAQWYEKKRQSIDKDKVTRLGVFSFFSDHQGVEDALKMSQSQKVKRGAKCEAVPTAVASLRFVLKPLDEDENKKYAFDHIVTSVPPELLTTRHTEWQERFRDGVAQYPVIETLMTEGEHLDTIQNNMEHFQDKLTHVFQTGRLSPQTATIICDLRNRWRECIDGATALSDSPVLQMEYATRAFCEFKHYVNFKMSGAASHGVLNHFRDPASLRDYLFT
jgi:hypothetical protein